MAIFYFIVGTTLAIGLGVALYEWHHKRKLLKHDLNLQPMVDQHTRAAAIQAKDVTTHRISSFDR